MTRNEAVAQAASLCGASLALDSGGARLVNIAPDGAKGILRRLDGTGPAYSIEDTDGVFALAELNTGQLNSALAQHRNAERVKAEAELAEHDNERAAKAQRVTDLGGNPGQGPTAVEDEVKIRGRS